MQRKLSIVLASSIISTSAFAIPQTVVDSPLFSGLYTGISFGWKNLEVNDSQVNFRSNEASLTYYQQETRNAVTGGISLGYSIILQNRYLLALEGRANVEDINLTISNSALIKGSVSDTTSLTSTAIGLTNDFSLLVKLGLTLQPNLLFYGIVGPTWGNFQYSKTLQIDIVGTGVEPINIHAKSILPTDSVYTTGYLVGLGMEYAISKNVSLSLEYNYSAYGEHTPDDIFITTEGTTTLKDDIQSQSVNSVILGIRFYFDPTTPRNNLKIKN